MRVSMPPPSVPGSRVQNSRMRLSSPITSSLSSPWYLRSCGTAPIEANWKIWLRAPMVVRPSMTTWGPTTVPAPICTRGPITEYGPTRTSGASVAPAAMMAVGWICGALIAAASLLGFPRVVACDHLIGQVEVAGAVQHAAARLLEDDAVATFLAELLDHALQLLEQLDGQLVVFLLQLALRVLVGPFEVAQLALVVLLQIAGLLFLHHRGLLLELLLHRVELKIGRASCR